MEDTDSKDAIFVDAQGNVGLSNSKPAARLDVNGDASVSGTVTATHTVTAKGFLGDGTGLTVNGPATLQAAKFAGKPVVIDFSADWCVPCREMERTTFVDPAVVREADGIVRLRANLTAENAANEAIIKEFTVEGVPTMVFIDDQGVIRKRRVGYVGPGEFLGYLRELK